MTPIDLLIYHRLEGIVLTDVDDLSKELGELYKGTGAALVTESAVMHNRGKVPTPLPHLNCILGGGFPLGCIVEAYGVPTSGKSSSMYQTMGNFQKKFSNGVAIIVDTEASVDVARMEFMGCDASKILRIPSTTIETGFNSIFQILDKKGKSDKLRDIPVMILWDTLGTNPSDKEFESKSQYGEGMMGNAKLIKSKLKLLLPYIESQPVLVVLLNQVTTEKTMYTAKLNSGGGWAIKHNAHIRLEYGSGATQYDGVYAVSKDSSVSIVKSKLSPLFNGLDVFIDITKGGVINPELSMVLYAKKLGLINTGAWSNLGPLVDKYPEYKGKFDKIFGHSFRFNELIEYVKGRPKLSKVIELAFIDQISEKYSYQAEVCKEYRQELLDSINAPEPVVQEDGSIVDIWTGEVLTEASVQNDESVESGDMSEVENTDGQSGESEEINEPTEEKV